MINPTLYILAAGIGNKFGGMKQMDEVGPFGETLLDYTVFDAVRAGFKRIVFVLFASAEKEFKETIIERYQSKLEATFELVMQDKDSIVDPDNKFKTPYPWSSIRALNAGQKFINEPFAVINGEEFFGFATFVQLVKALKKEITPTSYCNITFELEKTVSETVSSTRGICTIDEDNISEIVDHKEVEYTGGKIYFKNIDKQREVLDGKLDTSMNVWVFHPSIFTHTERFLQLLYTENGINAKASFTITQMVNALLKENAITLKSLHSEGRWMSIESSDDRMPVILKINEYIKSGLYPKRLWNNT